MPSDVTTRPPRMRYPSGKFISLTHAFVGLPRRSVQTAESGRIVSRICKAGFPNLRSGTQRVRSLPMASAICPFGRRRILLPTLFNEKGKPGDLVDQASILSIDI